MVLVQGGLSMNKKKTKSPDNLLAQVIKRLGHGCESINYLKTKYIISRPIFIKQIWNGGKYAN